MDHLEIKNYFQMHILSLRYQMMHGEGSGPPLQSLCGVGRPYWYHKGLVKGRGNTSYHVIPLARPKSCHREQ